MPATHCALLVMIVEYQDKFKRLPPLEYLKEVNLDQKAQFMVYEVPEIGPVGNSSPENLPSAREMMAYQRQEATKKAKKDKRWQFHTYQQTAPARGICKKR